LVIFFYLFFKSYKIKCSKNFLKNDEPLIKPDLEKKKDPDLQNGLGKKKRDQNY